MTDNREALWFKQVPEGYVFRAPNPWIFGSARHFLVNEAQKAQLLTVLTARSQSATLTIVVLACLAMFGASITAVIYAAGDNDYPVGIFVATIVLVLLSLYAALLIVTLPLAGRVEPLLAGLPPTDQRITAADRRAAAQQAIWLPSHLTLVASQMILSAMFFVQAMRATGGNPAAIFKGLAAFSSTFAGCCFAFSSIVLLIPALKKLRQGRQETVQETVPADQRFKKMLLPGFSLVVSIAALGLVIYAGQMQTKTEAAATQRREKSFEISKRLGVLTERVNKSTAARASVKTRVAANTARMTTLIDKLNHPTVKCETPASSDCTERARQERQSVEADIGKTQQEAAALAKENVAIEKETADINAELAALQRENDANR
jgi:hypothetical protein